MSKLRTKPEMPLMWLFSALFLICIASACGGKNAQEGQELHALEEEVMEIHDEVMPRMSEINKLIKRLEESYGSEELDTALLDRVLYHKNALIEADSLMWAWMHGYQPPARDGNPDSIRRYLTLERDKVFVVREKMLSSITNANKLIQKLTPDVR